MTCKVAFIGLGVMGYPMAGYISKAGHNVTVYNRTKSKAEKWIKEYKGKMENVDSYMNLIMTDAEELRDGKTVEKFGRVILRGNNVLFIKLENEL